MYSSQEWQDIYICYFEASLYYKKKEVNKMLLQEEIFSSEEFNKKYYYDGNDLGSIYTKEKTKFRVWAPTATEVSLNLYKEGSGNNLIEIVSMEQDVKGTWVAEVNKDLNGVYYTYLVTVEGKSNEAADIYGRTSGVNGKRTMVIDLLSTNPDSWQNDVKPPFVKMTDAVLYELHVRDMSMDKSSDIINKGKFLGIIEEGTTNSYGQKTGIDHIKELGITHLHLLPSFDFKTIDESKLEENKFNWGYDPQNYNIPEGSYSPDPTNGAVRVQEFKKMVQGLHKNGIRVVMDVVYNHTFTALDSDFNKTVPNYYYRTKNGIFTDASACGNETASERLMVRKMITDSLVYWATEYKVDGFRFDLMGIHDIETMNGIRKALDKVDPSIILYGEGWTGGDSPLPEHLRAVKSNTYLMPGIAAFSDDMRDAVKGHVFYEDEKGFVSGEKDLVESIKFGVVGAIAHDQIDYSKVKYSDRPWAKEPSQAVNYVSAHDNLTLWDKLNISTPESSYEDRVKMNKLSAAIVLTSQGIPFMQAGEEMLRSKPVDESRTKFDENSYVSPDSINSIKWDEKYSNISIFNYYKGLIAFRKAHPALRMESATDVQERIRFLNNVPAKTVAFTIDAKMKDETADSIIVIYNPNTVAKEFTLPSGRWTAYINEDFAGVTPLATVTNGKVYVAPISAMVLVKEQQVKMQMNKKAKLTALGVGAIASGILLGLLIKKRRR
jgi:pullulanase